MTVDKQTLQDVLARSLVKGIDLADIFVEEWQTMNIQMRNNMFKSITPAGQKGAGIRLVKGLETYYCSTGDLDTDSLMTAAGEVAGMSKLEPAGRSIAIGEHKQEAFELADSTFTLPLADKLAYVQQGNDFAWNYSDKVVQVIVSFSEYIRAIQLLNLDGHWVKENRNIIEFRVSVIVKDQGKSFMATEGFGAYDDVTVFQRRQPDQVAKDACDLALRMLYAKPSPAGEMPVVIGNGAGGTGAVFHEACGHGLEADFQRKGISVYRNQLGRQVASPLVSIIDDATIPRRKGSFKYDEEGTPGQKTYAIKQGVLNTYLTDRINGKDLDRYTGNGRRENFRYPPVPRQSNLYVDKGAHKKDEIIASVDKGLYVKRVGGGIVDSAKGDFSFNVLEGYLIEAGKLTEPVRGAVLTGNGPRVLKEIDMVADDLELGNGMGGCGKVNQFVPVDMGCPTLRIPRMIVGGTGSK